MTFASGKYYASSYGGGPSGAYHRGGKVKVASIISSPRSGQGYPILIEGLSSPTSLGWVKKSQLSGYRRGVGKLGSSQWALVDEAGEELILGAGRTGRLEYLRKGSGVIPADLTKNLMEWGKHNISDLMLPKSLAAKLPEIARAGYASELRFDSMLHVDNATSDSIPLLKKEMENVLEAFAKKQNYALKRYAR